MRLISTRKRRERERARRHGFPVMLRIVGAGHLAPGMVLGVTGISGTPTKAGTTTFTIRAVRGATDFRQPAERVLTVRVKEPAQDHPGG